MSDVCKQVEEKVILRSMEPDVLKISEQELRLLHQEGAKSYFSASRFYNPAIWAWLGAGRRAIPESYYLKIHTNYFFGLSFYAWGIINKDIKDVIRGLELLYEALNPHILFKNFILFDAVFQDTVFLANPYGHIQAIIKHPKISKSLSIKFPDETPYDFNSVKQFPSVDDNSIKLRIEQVPAENIVGALILPQAYLSEERGTFFRILHKGRSGRRPKDELIELFGGRETIKTEEIGSLRFTNPFSQILCCDFEPEFNAFANALECLDNAQFKALQRSEKKTEIGENKKSMKSDSPIRNERDVDGFMLPPHVGIKAIPQGAKTIQSHIKHGFWGFSNVLRGLPPDDRAHDYSKSIKTVAAKHLADSQTYLIHYDKTKKEFWTLVENKYLFQRRKQGRKKRD